jgi:hydroxyacylglutathione hydrolase
MASVLHVCAFEDNYIWLIGGRSREHVAIVDPGDAEPVLAALQARHLTPVAILCTHHHGDHVGGVADLLQHFSVPVYGPAREAISNLTHRLKHGDHVPLPKLECEFTVLEVPGHTAGHIAFFGEGLLFCGDTLFSAGCGRLFEGTAEQMHASLSTLAALPPDTAVYCGHEYTAANLRFAATVEPDNPDIATHAHWVRTQRTQELPTLPSNIGLERRINPFLRTDVPAVQRAAEAHAGQRLATNVNVFAALRQWKDGFRG